MDSLRMASTFIKCPRWAMAKTLGNVSSIFRNRLSTYHFKNARVVSGMYSCRRYATTDSKHVYTSSFPDVHIPSDVTLTHYLLDDFGRYGDRVAMHDVSSGESQTFSELQTDIIRVASALSRLGLAKGDVVTIIMPNCLQFATLFLAITAVGAVASAVNPLYTAADLHHTLQHSSTQLLFTVPSLLPTAQKAATNCPDLKEIIVVGSADGVRPFSSLLEDDGGAFPENLDLIPKEDLAALPYSSGTTGLPKGVMLSHYNMVANLAQMSSPIMGTTLPGDTYIGVLPFFHIYGLAVVLLEGLKKGAKIAIMPKFDPGIFLQTIQEHKATHMHIVPPIVLFLAKHPMVSDYDLSSVRHILSAAAPLGVEMVEMVRGRLSNNKELIFKQGYGMTETSPITHASPDYSTKIAAVGQVVPNTMGKVIDVTTGEVLAPNLEGEICMKGPQVMVGYYQNARATADTVDADGWIHSGDLGYVDEEGFFFITDRLKELIKYKGLQVAPAELESLLLTHPGVQDTAVIGIPDERAGELPRAYVVPKPGVTLTETELQDFVKGKVAIYKELNGGVDIRTEIPKSASGKILRRLLKDEFTKGKK